MLSTLIPFPLAAITLAAMSSALGWSDDEDDSDEELEKQDGPARNNMSGQTSDDEQWINGNSFFAEILADFQDEVGQ